MVNSIPSSEISTHLRIAVGDLVKGPARTVTVRSSAREAAARMLSEKIGSLVVVEADHPIGIVTKTDLVKQLVAQGRGAEVPVADVMTPRPLSVAAETPVLDALLLMIRYRIRHLLVMQGGRLQGVVSERDWLQAHDRHPLALLREVDAANRVADLAALRRKIVLAVGEWAGDNLDAAGLTRMIAEINDGITISELAACLNQDGLPEPGAG